MTESGYVSRFVRDRNEALLSLDRAKIERFAKKYGVTMPTSDEAFWRGVHKAICNITNIPFEVRQKSADWLFEHGSTPEIGEDARWSLGVIAEDWNNRA